MPTRPCPHCQQSAPHLPHSSKHATADYYRCDPCRFVFTVDKSNPNGPHHAVTRNRPPDGGSATSF